MDAGSATWAQHGWAAGLVAGAATLERLPQPSTQLAGLWTELLLRRLGGAPSQRGN